MQTAYALIVTGVAAAALGTLNAMRGSGYQILRYVIAVLCGSVLLLLHSVWYKALAEAVFVLLFFLQPWGRWYTLGNAPRSLGGPPSVYEAFIERLGGDSDQLCWTISATLFALPLLALSPVWLALPILLPFIYGLTWHIFQSAKAIRAGEFGTGILLGLLTGISSATLWPFW